MDPIKGGCLCGAVQFEITGRPLSLSYCHCARCRKQAGLFAAVLMVRREDFRLLAGAEAIRRYVPDAPWMHMRAFCGTCGSPLGEPSDAHDIFPIAASALDDDPGVRPVLHQHASALPTWCKILDGVKQIPGAYRG